MSLSAAAALPLTSGTRRHRHANTTKSTPLVVAVNETTWVVEESPFHYAIVNDALSGSGRIEIPTTTTTSATGTVAATPTATAPAMYCCDQC